MGSCCSSSDQETLKSSFQESWSVFRGTDMIKSDRFFKSRERIYRFLFLSVAIPFRRYTKNRINQYLGKYPALHEEARALEQDIIILQREFQALHKELSKIQSSIFEDEQRPKKGFNVSIPQPCQQKPIRKDRNQLQDNDDRDSQKPLKILKQDNNAAAPRQRGDSMQQQSISEMPEANIRSSYNTYSLPLTVFDSEIDQSYIDQPQPDYATYSRDKLFEKIEFEMEKREASQKAVISLTLKVQLLNADLQQLSNKRNQLLEELQKKNNYQKNQENSHVEEGLRSQIVNITKEREELKSKFNQLSFEIEEYRLEMSKLDKEREKLIQENNYLRLKMKDVSQTFSSSHSIMQHLSEDTTANFSLNVLNSHELPQKKPSNLTLQHNLEERIEPTLVHLNSFSSRDNNSKYNVRSFSVMEEATNEDNYAILFNLFSNSKILPSHHEFQNAVGTRTVIAEMFDIKPSRTELLYAFDSITPNHYTRYIEKRDNLLILIKLPNGITLGAFGGSFTPNSLLIGSFIFSISAHREPMKLTSTRAIQPINADPAYLILGNSQLKIKARTLELTCNVGSFQSIYTFGNKNIPIEKFLGGAQRNLLMSGYEIHQLYFEQFFP